MAIEEAVTGSERRTVAALFAAPMQAQQAVHDLKQAGFAGADIGVAMRNTQDASALQQEPGMEDTAAADIGKDAASSGVLGGIVGLLVGAGALAIPGIGPVVAGGVFASVLGSTAVGAGLGAVGGGIIGALVHMGLTEHEASYFASGFQEGGVLVTVHPGERAQEATAVLAHNGGDMGVASGLAGEYADYGGIVPRTGASQ